jgi:hypothetical protein
MLISGDGNHETSDSVRSEKAGQRSFRCAPADDEAILFDGGVSFVEPLITPRIDANLYYGQNFRSAWDVENSHC